MTGKKPSTADVRFRFAEHRYLVDGRDDDARARREAERFDRWLASEKAKAWDEGLKAGRNADHNATWWPANPYRGSARRQT